MYSEQSCFNIWLTSDFPFSLSPTSPLLSHSLSVSPSLSLPFLHFLFYLFLCLPLFPSLSLHLSFCLLSLSFCLFVISNLPPHFSQFLPLHLCPSLFPPPPSLSFPPFLSLQFLGVIISWLYITRVEDAINEYGNYMDGLLSSSAGKRVAKHHGRMAKWFKCMPDIDWWNSSSSSQHGEDTDVGRDQLEVVELQCCHMLLQWKNLQWGKKKYLVSHHMCKFCPLKWWQRSVVFIIGTLPLWETKCGEKNPGCRIFYK